MTETELSSRGEGAQAEDARAGAAFRRERAGQDATIVEPASVEQSSAMPRSERSPDPSARQSLPAEHPELNQLDSYHRGPLAGMARLADLSDVVTTPDPPSSGPKPNSGRDAIAAEWRKIVAARAGYDVMDPFDTSLDAAAKQMSQPWQPVGKEAVQVPEAPDLFDRLFPPSEVWVPRPGEERLRRAITKTIFEMTAEPLINIARGATGNMPKEEWQDFALETLVTAVLLPIARAGKPAAKTGKSLASRPGFLHEPPDVDPTYASADPEGRRLKAEHVVGRIREGMDDAGLYAEKYGDVIEGLARISPKRSLAAQLKELFGDQELPPIEPKRIKEPEEEVLLFYLKGVRDEIIEKFGYEVGQVVDDIVGGVSTKGLLPELREVYNALNNPNRDKHGMVAGSKLFTPKDAGFKGDDARRVDIAEAIRAYLTNPHYLKTMAPKTAAAIRAAVNEHPRLSKIIQFNAAAGLAAPTLMDTEAAGEGSFEDSRL